MRTCVFEILMLVCFGAAWPFSIYRSRYGCTRRYAELLAGKLAGQVTVADLRREAQLSPAAFDLVLLGSPIYAGAVPSGVTRFCERHRAALLRLPVGLSRFRAEDLQDILRRVGQLPS